MNDRYHAHITLPWSAQNIPKGWKETTIVLIGEHEQKDIMLTKHFVCGRNVKDLAEIYDELHDISEHFIVLRIKLEKDNNFTEKLDEMNYLECHCKVKGDTTFDNTWVKSRNPKHIIDGEGIFFWNKRVGKGNVHFEMGMISDEILACTGPEGAMEVKFEQVIFDSNREHDAWWGKV